MQEVTPITRTQRYWEEAERNALTALNYARRMLGKAAVELTDNEPPEEAA